MRDAGKGHDSAYGCTARAFDCRDQFTCAEDHGDFSCTDVLFDCSGTYYNSC